MFDGLDSLEYNAVDPRIGEYAVFADSVRTSRPGMVVATPKPRG
jgi:hypothetical protein